MLGKEKSEEKKVRSILGKGAEFTGKLMFDGSARIDGDFKGTIFGSGMLVIGEGAEIEADIIVDAILIRGEVRGQIDVKKTIRIYSTGRVLGDLSTEIFAADEGAFFQGTCHMAHSDAEVHTLPLQQTAASMVTAE
jgi:cytoskeletal protein CcmA (bactofilin family)